MCEGRGQQNIGYMRDEGCKGKTWVCQNREIPNEANPTGSQGAGQEKQLSRTRNQHWGALRSGLWMVSEQELRSRGHSHAQTQDPASALAEGHGKGVALGPGTCDV